MVIFMSKNGKYRKVSVVAKLAKAINEYRYNNNLSKEELANIIGITPRHLVNLETCNSKCKIDTLAKIIKVINVDIKYIFENDEEKN